MLTKRSTHIIRQTLAMATGLLMAVTASGFVTRDGSGVYPVSKVFNFRIKGWISAAETMNRLKQKADIARDYAIENGYDPSYCFLVDMRLPSGKNRFFVYNLDKETVEIAGLVAHGKGSETGSDGLTFSNKPNSNCTSLGKYKIGKSYNGSFGLSYRLIGLDKTNSKAYERAVVLHSYNGVPAKEVFPAPICVSEGCPTIAPDFLTQVKVYLDGRDLPILLWIYY